MAQKILVIEDNDRNRRLVRLLLKAKGYEVIEAATAEEAIECLKGLKPDLILMDIQLPNTDGLALTKQIKSKDERFETQAVMFENKTVLIKPDEDEFIDQWTNWPKVSHDDVLDAEFMVASNIKGAPTGENEASAEAV